MILSAPSITVLCSRLCRKRRIRCNLIRTSTTNKPTKMAAAGEGFMSHACHFIGYDIDKVQDYFVEYMGNLMEDRRLMQCFLALAIQSISRHSCRFINSSLFSRLGMSKKEKKPKIYDFRVDVLDNFTGIVDGTRFRTANREGD